jgi:hypothetical protein
MTDRPQVTNISVQNKDPTASRKANDKFLLLFITLPHGLGDLAFLYSERQYYSRWNGGTIETGMFCN